MFGARDVIKCLSSVTTVLVDKTLPDTVQLRQYLWIKLYQTLFQFKILYMDKSDELYIAKQKQKTQNARQVLFAN